MCSAPWRFLFSTRLHFLAILSTSGRLVHGSLAISLIPWLIFCLHNRFSFLSRSHLFLYLPWSTCTPLGRFFVSHRAGSGSSQPWHLLPSFLARPPLPAQLQLGRANSLALGSSTRHSSSSILKCCCLVFVLDSPSAPPRRPSNFLEGARPCFPALLDDRLILRGLFSF